MHSKPPRRPRPDREALDARIAQLVVQLLLQAVADAHDFQPSWEDFKAACQ